MRNKFQITIGIGVILLGMILLISNLTGIPLWSYIWPLLFISLGIWMIVRPKKFDWSSVTTYKFIGNIDYPRNHSLKDENIVSFIGDIHIDLVHSEIPLGETQIELRGFVSDIDILLPPDTGLSIISNAFVTSADVDGYKQDYFLNTYAWHSENYQKEERNVCIDLGFFVTDINIKQVKKRKNDDGIK